MILTDVADITWNMETHENTLSVVLAHNYYSQVGGEDRVVERELELLRSKGHRVAVFTCRSNRRSGWDQVAASARALGGLYNVHAKSQLADLLRQVKPDLVHVHNTFPLMSPAILSACKHAGVPVVVTLHNYRLLCPAATMYKSGRICEDCRSSGWLWHSVLRGCYHNSHVLSAAASLTVGLHDVLRTWERAVEMFITPSEFTRSKFVAAGWPSGRVTVKPHFISPDPGPGSHSGGYCLFVGRLTEEKGIRTLLRAWETVRTEFRLKIVGDGPLAPEVADIAARNNSVEWLGEQSSSEVNALLGGAEFLVVPSECFETFGLVIIEAFARATPVVASRIGALAELVRDGKTGILFPPGNAAALAAIIESLVRTQQTLPELGRQARAEFERAYGAERNYELLRAVYRRALQLGAR